MLKVTGSYYNFTYDCKNSFGYFCSVYLYHVLLSEAVDLQSNSGNGIKRIFSRNGSTFLWERMAAHVLQCSNSSPYRASNSNSRSTNYVLTSNIVQLDCGTRVLFEKKSNVRGGMPTLMSAQVAIAILPRHCPARTDEKRVSCLNPKYFAIIIAVWADQIFIKVRCSVSCFIPKKHLVDFLSETK